MPSIVAVIECNQRTGIHLIGIDQPVHVIAGDVVGQRVKCMAS